MRIPAGFRANSQTELISARSTCDRCVRWDDFPFTDTSVETSDSLLNRGELLQLMVNRLSGCASELSHCPLRPFNVRVLQKALLKFPNYVLPGGKEEKRTGCSVTFVQVILQGIISKVHRTPQKQNRWFSSWIVSTSESLISMNGFLCPFHQLLSVKQCFPKWVLFRFALIWFGELKT